MTFIELLLTHVASEAQLVKSGVVTPQQTGCARPGPQHL